uniref:Si:dkeyp-30e7.2 n=1 Tax=Nothobranchius kuhntae TaxID=321403 RepID=A0A1A8IKB3_NOTKU
MDSAKNKKRAASSTSGTPAQTPNKSKKPRRVYSSAGKRAKLEYDRRRQRTRINIGPAFEEWKMLRKSLRMKTHPQLASFLLKRCFHAPLAENPDKELIPHGSAAHVALSRIVLNQRWLKDIEKLLTFRTTAELESFQNHILMYAGKRFAFSFGVYEARTLLAALDYNHHNHRPVHVNIKGQVSHKRVYNKKSQRYSVHTVKETKDYGYIPELQTRILEKRLSSAGGLPKRRSIQADDPRALGPLSGISPPPTAELVQTQQRRGQDLCDT